MVTFLAGGTGTPKLLDGAAATFDPASTTVVGNTGDDVELGGLLVCPDLDTVLFHGGGVLDRETWWGIDGDTHETDDELFRLAAAADLGTGPRYLPAARQTAGRDIAAWRRFSGVAEFMTIGDRDRAVHITRTSLLDEGESLTEVTATLADAFDLAVDLLPMSDDPVATIVHTDEGAMHFQEFWVGRRAEPAVEAVEFRGTHGGDAGRADRGGDEDRASARGSDDASARGSDEHPPSALAGTDETLGAAAPTPETLEALADDVVIGPSNPVTSIGPMLALPGVREALHETMVVAVSPFVEDTVFSGPAGELMEGVGYAASTAGVADAYPFADAFVLDEADGTGLDRPVVRTDTRLDGPDDAARVAAAVAEALEVAG